MFYQHTIAVALLALLAAATGCVGVTRPVHEASSQFSTAAKRMGNAWRRMTEDRTSAQPPVWNWHSGLPSAAPRADLISATIPPQAVAYYLPSVEHSSIRLVSTAPSAHAMPGFEIRNIGGHRIDNVSDLHRALNHVAPHARKIQVDLAAAPHIDRELAVEVDRSTLQALCHSVADDQVVLKSAEDGNAWLIVRSGGVRAKLMARIERNHNLVQVVISLANCWDHDMLLPVEIQAAADGSPLNCLTVAQTLEILYNADPGATSAAHQLGEGTLSFAAVSRRDDYLAPTNYRRLEERLSSIRQTSIQSARPALVSVPGVAYPGSAVLGDVRALAGFLLQQQIMKRGEPDRVGWVMFHGPEAGDAQQIDVLLDLGRGPQSFRFVFPEQK